LRGYLEFVFDFHGDFLFKLLILIDKYFNLQAITAGRLSALLSALAVLPTRKFTLRL
jgi:hypothetical protein